MAETIHFGEKFRTLLAKYFSSKSVTDHAFNHNIDAEFSGSDTVHIYEIATTELNEYNKKQDPSTGSRFGAVQEVGDHRYTFKLTQDISLDRSVDRGNNDAQFNIKKAGAIMNYTSAGTINYVDLEWVVKGNNETRMVTGYAIKKGKHYNDYMQTLHHKGTTGSIVFRGTEALLNYMEACYVKTGSIDGTADKYWKALRTRAKVDSDYNKTIAATVMTKEAEGDFGAYSHGQLVDATLYNIRRERRNEFIGEGLRWADLKRWRACDQVNGYQIEGMRYWGSDYEGTWQDDSGHDLVVVDVAGGSGNMSDQSTSGVYIRPYQISNVNNSVFNGYRFTPAHYLSPLPQNAFRQTASGDKTDLNTSVIYQNPGWPKVGGQGPAM